MAVPLSSSLGPGTPETAPDGELERLEIELLLEAVYRRYGFDFRQYAKASLKRRLHRRLQAEAAFETLAVRGPENERSERWLTWRVHHIHYVLRKK